MTPTVHESLAALQEWISLSQALRVAIQEDIEGSLKYRPHTQVDVIRKLCQRLAQLWGTE